MNFTKLGDTSHDFLQVLLTEFVLTRKEKGVQLDVHLSEDLDTIRKGSEKWVINKKYNNKTNRKNLEASLDTFKTSDNILSYRFDCTNYPLRYANGGVLPIIRLDGTDYFCFFYRSVFPAGWNIANGGSNTFDDLLHPFKIVNREFLEELFFFDHVNKLHYCLDTNPDKYSSGTYKESYRLWKEKLANPDLDNYEKLPLPIKWIDGPDKINIYSNNKTCSTEGVFVNITPGDNAIEIDRMALINMKNDIVLFDGEVDKILINRIIGLFSVDNVLKTLDNKTFVPDLIFYNGGKHESSKMNFLLESSYFPSHNEAGIRTRQQDSYFRSLTDKLDLCPITRSLVEKYAEWSIKPEEEISLPNHGRQTKKETANYEVFVSYKSEDTDIAFWLYDFLQGNRFQTFCSGKSIQLMGESDYARVIDKALDQSTFLIVLGTQPEYLDSGWVSYEWRSFLNEIHSGRKPDGKVFTLTQDIPVSNLPYALRSTQNIPFSKSTFSEAFKNLLIFITKKGF